MQKPTRILLDNRKTFIKSYWGAALWAAFIMLLCGLPGEDLPNIDIWNIDFEDKLAHVGVFSILTFLIVFGFHRRNSFKKLTLQTANMIVVIASVYGGLTEVLQDILFESRYSSIPDFIADFIGSVLGTIIAKFYFVNKSR